MLKGKELDKSFQSLKNFSHNCYLLKRTLSYNVIYVNGVSFLKKEFKLVHNTFKEKKCDVEKKRINFFYELIHR